jgi:hypothetical protein
MSDQVLLAALAAGDHALAAQLYMRAAETSADDDSSAFYATHAYVHALQAGQAAIEERAGALLRRLGRLR